MNIWQSRAITKRREELSNNFIQRTPEEQQRVNAALIAYVRKRDYLDYFEGWSR